jgi:hypothetical protein
VGIFFVAVGIIGLLFRGEVFGHYYLYVLLQIFVIAFGTQHIIQYYIGSKHCPKCNQQAMHPLGKDESIKLIRKYDLNLGENPLPNPKANSNS